MDLEIILFGLGVGILVGLTGIGGGSLMTPLLILAGGVQPVVAIGTDLAYGAVTKTVGGWRHWRAGTVDLGVTGWMAVGSVPGSLVGVWLIDRLHERYGDGFDTILLSTVAGALLIVSISILGRALFMPRLADREREHVPLTRRVRIGAASIGGALGLVVGATSVGSGALIGLALILVFRLTPHRVVGTDVAHAAILLWAAGLAHFFSGNVDLMLMATILVGSLPGRLDRYRAAPPRSRRRAAARAGLRAARRRAGRRQQGGRRGPRLRDRRRAAARRPVRLRALPGATPGARGGAGMSFSFFPSSFLLPLPSPPSSPPFFPFFSSSLTSFLLLFLSSLHILFSYLFLFSYISLFFFPLSLSLSFFLLLFFSCFFFLLPSCCFFSVSFFSSSSVSFFFASSLFYFYFSLSFFCFFLFSVVLLSLLSPISSCSSLP